ncbi:MAG: DUF2834 domain-containing protein [Leptolyngbyaceae bacterium]|nr:DUF2834 domain-containing protein [Leptolyngbyaceae bacterium]
MIRSIFFWLVWLGFIGYSVVFAPPDQPDTFALIRDLATGQWKDINPLIVGLFNVMGLWPLIYGALMITDGCGQRLPAWPFAIASFAVGAFAVLPYLALRKPNPDSVESPNGVIRIANSRWLGGAIALGAIGFLAYAFSGGNWGVFVELWHQSKFIHVMSLDFCMLCALVGGLLGDDMARRGLGDRRLFWAIVLTPLLGIVAYLCFRPPLLADVETVGHPA